MNQLFTLYNAKGIIYSFCKGFADSLRGAVDLFLLDSKLSQEKELKLLQKDLHKEALLNRSSPVRELQSFAKRRSVERRILRRSSSPSGGGGGGGNDNVKSVNRENPKILERTLKCCALNGCVFWFSIVVFENVILPSIRASLLLLLGSSDLTDRLWSWTLPMATTTFSTLWVLPFFLLSKIVNAIWFQDIADSAFRSCKGTPRMMSSISVMIADTVFSILIESIFLVQGKICSLLPVKIVGDAINLLHLCLLHSLYCFEYKWFNQGLELHKRLMFIEVNWPYFLGFGFPLAVLTSMPSSFVVSGCVFAILFPLFIVSGNQAQVVTGACTVPLHLFSPTILISNTLFDKLFNTNKK